MITHPNRTAHLIKPPQNSWTSAVQFLCTLWSMTVPFSQSRAGLACTNTAVSLPRPEHGYIYHYVVICAWLQLYYDLFVVLLFRYAQLTLQIYRLCKVVLSGSHRLPMLGFMHEQPYHAHLFQLCQGQWSVPSVRECSLLSGEIILNIKDIIIFFCDFLSFWLEKTHILIVSLQK